MKVEDAVALERELDAAKEEFEATGARNLSGLSPKERILAAVAHERAKMRYEEAVRAYYIAIQELARQEPTAPQ
jgi:hypothetical protein